MNAFCGSMRVFLLVTISIVVWRFAGNVVGFDKTPRALLLTVLDLPQLSIMISVQVSADRAQAASDVRAVADDETPIALHAMASPQLTILNGQNTILDTLQDLSAHDMVERQKTMLETRSQIISLIEGQPATAWALLSGNQEPNIVIHCSGVRSRNT